MTGAKQAPVGEACRYHWLVGGLSQKFWSGEKIGLGDQNSRNNGPPRPFSLEKFGPDWNNSSSTSTVFDHNGRL